MQLPGLGQRFPAQLSGGQRQRVALARALALDPKVLLLDEPFGALDAKVRSELREWLRELQQKLRLTTIFVTHDQHEAFQLADRIAILQAGRIEQVGTPAEIRAMPLTPFVTDFIGAVTDRPKPECNCAVPASASIAPKAHVRHNRRLNDKSRCFGTGGLAHFRNSAAVQRERSSAAASGEDRAG